MTYSESSGGNEANLARAPRREKTLEEPARLMAHSPDPDGHSIRRQVLALELTDNHRFTHEIPDRPVLRTPQTVGGIFFAALVLGGAVVAIPRIVTAQGPPSVWEPRPATYGVAVERNVRVTMSDGARLAVSILRPALPDGAPTPDRFPVVLTQTSYTEDSDRSDYLIERGYVQVIAQARGTGSSEGLNTFGGAREQLDGAELVEWVASPDRPWSDGRVALYGASFMGMYALLTAAQQPPAVKAVFAMSPPGDTYRDISAPGGQYSVFVTSLGLVLAPPMSLVPPGYTAEDPLSAATILLSHAVSPLMYQVPNMVNQVSGGDLAFDGPSYWSRSPLYYVDRIDVPTFIIGGWFDLFQRGDPMLFEKLSERGTPVKLLMGPWDHITGPWSGPLSGDPTATQRLNELALGWFDYHVAGYPDPDPASLPDVTYYRLGTDSYETALQWPPGSVEYRELYLSGPASLGRPGALTDMPSPAGEVDTLLWHPAAGLCSPTAASGFVSPGPCAGDQRLNSALALSYDFPVSENIDITGPLAARIHVATNGQDVYLVTRVQDVAPDGAVAVLATGSQLVSFRALDQSQSLIVRSTSGTDVLARPYHPFTRESVLPVEPGEVYEVWVEIPPIAARIPAGHILRLAIEPSDTPHAISTVPQITELVGSVAHIHHDASYPSALVVPITQSP